MNSKNKLRFYSKRKILKYFSCIELIDIEKKSEIKLLSIDVQILNNQQ